MIFEHNFWPSNNDFGQVIKRIDTRTQQSVRENEQILQFLNNRLAIESLYGNSLRDLAGIKREVNGFNAEEGASLARSFDALKESYIVSGLEHLDLANSLKSMVIDPLDRIFYEYKMALNSYKKPILDKIQEFESSVYKIKPAKLDYFEKCKIADELEEQAILDADQKDKDNKLAPINGQSYLFGKLTFNILDLKHFLNRIQLLGPSSIAKTQFLGIFRNLVTGQDICQWLLKEYSNVLLVPSDAVEVAQALVNQGFLRIIGPGSKFFPTTTSFYQWKKKAEDFQLEKNNHYSARLLASEADIHYRLLCFDADKLRLELEELMFKFLNLIEKNEESRIESIKAAFVSLAGIEANNDTNFSSIGNQLFPHLETLKAKQDVALMAEAYGTGPFQPSPILYENYYYGTGIDQNFGVPLELQAKAGRVPIPPTFQLLINSIQSGIKDKLLEDQIKTCIFESSLVEVHKLRNNLNKGKISPETMPIMKVEILASTLRLYLLELPDSLIPSHYYSKLKSIYQQNDTNNRMDELLVIINDLSPPNYLTLKSLIGFLKKLVNSLSLDDSLLQQVISSYSPCILRPSNDQIIAYFHHRHPHKLVKDLIFNVEILLHQSPEFDLMQVNDLPEQELIDFGSGELFKVKEKQTDNEVGINNIDINKEESKDEDVTIDSKQNGTKLNNVEKENEGKKKGGKKEEEEFVVHHAIQAESKEDNNDSNLSKPISEEDYLDLDLVDFEGSNSLNETEIIDLNENFFDEE